MTAPAIVEPRTCVARGCEADALATAERCAHHEARRIYAERRRQRRRGDLVALHGDATTHCQRRYCRAVCGGRLEVFIDRLGRTHIECPLCDRQAAGLCRDCPAKLEARSAVRCPRCAKRRDMKARRDWYYDNTERARRNGKRWRRRVMQDPVRREAFIARERAYQAEYRSGGWWNDYMRRWRERRRAFHGCEVRSQEAVA